MRKKLLLLIAVLILAVTVGALSSCDLVDRVIGKKEEPKVEIEYQLTGTLPTEIVYGEELDLSGLEIVITEGESVKKIPVTKNMITSGNTSKVGKTVIEFTYGGEKFTRTINVKYRVVFKNGDEVLSTQYVTKPEEIVPPTLESDDYMIFCGWAPSLAGGLNDNVTYIAVFEHNIPTLEKELTAVYGTKLKDITLPSNVAGEWKFDDAPSTTVGTAGKHTFDVSFILTSGEKVKGDSVSIDVSKKQIKLENIVTEFVYNGERQIPTFTFENFTPDESLVYFLEDGISDYTSAGTYEYEFFIDDPNLDGDVSFKGTYVIKEASVTVTVNSYTISMLDNIPEIEYTLEGTTLTEEQIGLSIKVPVVTAAGVYRIDAEITNPNVKLTVNQGTLTVTSVTPDINEVGKPAVIKGTAVFDFNNPTGRIS